MGQPVGMMIVNNIILIALLACFPPRTEPFRLYLTQSVTFTNSNWKELYVDEELEITFCKQIQSRYRQGCEYLVVGNTKHTPCEIEMAPELIPPILECLVLVACCVYPLLFLPKGQVITHAIPVPQCLWDDLDLSVYCTEVVGEEKPLLWYSLKSKGHNVQLQGMINTGADVMVIPLHKWPSQWELQDVDCKVLGVGGTQFAKQSKSIMQIMGPNGQLANICLFILNTKFTLWRRNYMSQWGGPN